MSEYKDFTVLVNLKGEAISLEAIDDSEAITRAREIVAEQYGESVAKDASYSID